MPETKFTYPDMIRCIKREITYRQAVYPNLVIRGKMTEGTKNREIALMQAILDVLYELSGEEYLKNLD